ncbi:unnamed protein product [Pleuronectes platessa]|uniref:Uncharacterized protein n=1 Tax=Pleuronectes platessa TaxID=8262 RepID=A0A9N7YH67_PLEPL|nr:unnamed protein product [Pleuronectes platessa]
MYQCGFNLESPLQYTSLKVILTLCTLFGQKEAPFCCCSRLDDPIYTFITQYAAGIPNRERHCGWKEDRNPMKN